MNNFDLLLQFFQELLIQQLQDEIRSLRQQGADFSGGADLSGAQGTTTNTAIQSLQQKLKHAAKKITELAKERQQLIEMGNKLRAELKRAGKTIYEVTRHLLYGLVDVLQIFALF